MKTTTEVRVNAENRTSRITGNTLKCIGPHLRRLKIGGILKLG